MTILSAVPLQAQERPPEILQIYRDFVKAGSELAYRAVEEAAARICVEFGCPHPHLAIESLTVPTEVWWLNAVSGGEATRIFAVRPYWGVPTNAWIDADPDFWKVNPASQAQ